MWVKVLGLQLLQLQAYPLEFPQSVGAELDPRRKFYIRLKIAVLQSRIDKCFRRLRRWTVLYRFLQSVRGLGYFYEH